MKYIQMYGIPACDPTLRPYCLTPPTDCPVGRQVGGECDGREEADGAHAQ